MQKHFRNMVVYPRTQPLQLLALALLLLMSGKLFAMSLFPEEDYKPAEWHEEADYVEDAERAIENEDFRLLAFATRSTIVPGMDAAKLETYRAACGLRFIKDFGDVIHSEEQRLQMKQARVYAEAYNVLISKQCLP